MGERERVVLLELAAWEVQRLEALVATKAGDAEMQERDRWELEVAARVACWHASLLQGNHAGMLACGEQEDSIMLYSITSPGGQGVAHVA